MVCTSVSDPSPIRSSVKKKEEEEQERDKTSVECCHREYKNCRTENIMCGLHIYIYVKKKEHEVWPAVHFQHAVSQPGAAPGQELAANY